MSESCRFEPQVTEAAASDRWTNPLREHVASCSDCTAAAAVAPWMSRFAKVRDREHMLPDPAVLWLKAQLLRSSAAAERIARPMNQVQWVAYITVAAGWAALLTWKWDAMMRWLGSITPQGMVAATGGAALSGSFLLTVLALGAMTVVLAVHTILAEE
jgi:hypothetical protein